jgi:hypothetical protein
LNWKERKKARKKDFAEEFLRKRKTTLKSFLFLKKIPEKKPVLEGKT